MNTTVTATGMKVQAKAEGGLLISATAQDGDWSNTDSVTLSKDAILLPASTSDGSTWYHAHSTDSDNATAITGYYTLTTGTSADVEPSSAALGDDGTLYTANENLGGSNEFAQITYDENGTNTAYDESVDDGFYLLTKYYIRSSGNAISINPTTGEYKALAINTIKVTTINGSANLDKSLRIGVQLYDESNTAVGQFVVLAPINGADGVSATAGTKSTTTANASDVAALVGLCSQSVTTYVANADTAFGKSALDTIPSNTSGDYLTANIYVWFEGEDSTCFSDNITNSLDELSIEISFKITNTSTEYDDVARAS